LVVPGAIPVRAAVLDRNQSLVCSHVGLTQHIRRMLQKAQGHADRVEARVRLPVKHLELIDQRLEASLCCDQVCHAGWILPQSARRKRAAVSAASDADRFNPVKLIFNPNWIRLRTIS
jgi:hypothetical protein